MSSEREDRDAFAELLALKISGPLREDLATIRSEAAHMREEVDRIGAFFSPGPDSLPAQVADLQKVVLNQEARLVDVEKGRKATLLENVKGGWGVVIAATAALGALVTALVSALWGKAS